MKLSQYTLGCAIAAGLIASASQAHAYQHNYTCRNGRNACGDDEQARPIVWHRSCVLFYMDQSGSNDFEKDPDGKASPRLEQIVKASFSEWTRPECSGLKLLYGGMVDPGDQQVGERRNVVVFEQEGWSQTSSMTFATTVVNYNPSTGEIRQADIKVNDQFYEFATRPNPAPGEADLRNTLTHEVGHFLGIAHSDVKDATMYGSAGLGETKKRTLHRDDIEGLCAHYPASEYTSTCGEDGKDDNSDLDHDGGKGSFGWGSNDEQASDSACSVTGVAGSAIMSPITPIVVLFVGLFGGALWRRRTGRNSDS